MYSLVFSCILFERSDNIFRSNRYFIYSARNCSTQNARGNELRPNSKPENDKSEILYHARARAHLSIDTTVLHADLNLSILDARMILGNAFQKACLKSAARASVRISLTSYARARFVTFTNVIVLKCAFTNITSHISLSLSTGKEAFHWKGFTHGSARRRARSSFAPFLHSTVTRARARK